VQAFVQVTNVVEDAALPEGGRLGNVIEHQQGLVTVQNHPQEFVQGDEPANLLAVLVDRTALARQAGGIRVSGKVTADRQQGPGR
jgi:hypothetical protein